MQNLRSLYIKRTCLLAFGVLMVLALAGCGGRAAVPDDGKLNVVATTGQIADALRNIGGDAIHLTGLLGPGIDPHLYVPTESNVAAFATADLIVYNGLDLEAQMSRILEQMEGRGVAVLALGDSLPEEMLLSWGNQFPHDPHIWNDVALWSQAVEIIRDTLIEMDPDNRDLYMQNSAEYLELLAETHQYVQEQINRIPPDMRLLITAHDAFSYFGRAYGLEVIGLQGISTESEASAADVTGLAETIVKRRIPAIFVESSVSPKTIEAVQAAVKAQGLNVSIGGSLYSDALGEVGSGADTYVGMLRQNADTLRDALGE